MNITTHEEGQVAVITLKGKVMSEADIAEFMDAVKDSMYNGKHGVVVDLTGVDWINSAGLGMLVAAQGLLKEIGGQLRLAGINNPVQKIINTNKLHLVLDIHPTVETAVSSLN